MDAREAFETLDLRVGTVTRAEPNVGARKPAYRLWIDFGPLGTKTSSAQLTDHYQPADLVGRSVIAAVNLGSIRISGFLSEVLVLGLSGENGGVVLLAPDKPVAPGGRVF
jgi:tRNA-binding protein